MDLYSTETSKLSWYRTDHVFKHVVDVKSDADYFEATRFAEKNNLMIYSLGNGSNTFFQRKKITTLIIRNCMPQFIRSLGGDEYEVSSSVNMMKLLRYLYANERDGPYNLASVPATIGGAVAMNAGTGESAGLYISKFLRSVIYLHNGERFVKPVEDLEMGFRRSLFSEQREYFIISALFVFPEREFDSNPITERLDWAKNNQELKVANCGSVWRKANWRILNFTYKLFSNSPAYISVKSRIWISNTSKSHRYILRILRFVRILHLLAFRKSEHEIRIVK